MTMGVKDEQLDLLFIQKKFDLEEGLVKGALELHLTTEDAM